MSTFTNVRATAVLAATGALLLAAFAMAPQAEASTIYACVKKKSGSARVFTKKPKCKKGETKISWNTEGLAGNNGTNGTNGTNGKEGVAGKEGKEGANGAVAGYSLTHSAGVEFQSGSEGSPTTIASRALPAGNYLVNGKTELLMSNTKAGGEASVSCKLVDTPSGGGGVVSDTSAWASLINFPFFIVDLAQNTVPFSLAVNSGAHSSTLSLVCWVGLLEASGGTFTVSAGNTSITAVQTTQNS